MVGGTPHSAAPAHRWRERLRPPRHSWPDCRQPSRPGSATRPDRPPDHHR